MTVGIEIWFNNMCLGILQRVDDGYIYNSNEFGENEFKEYKNSKKYDLFGSINKHYVHLPTVFNDIVQNIRKRTDLNEENDDFETLFNYAKRRQREFGYHVKIKV